MTGPGEPPPTTPAGWFARVAPCAAPRARLFAFPHAGAGPGALAAVAAHLDGEIEVWALNLPGRQARLAEPPRTDLGPLVAALAADLDATDLDATDADLPQLFLGYCGGALLAHLVARSHVPDRLVVGSYPAPDVARIPRRLHRLPSADFWAAVLDEGGIPADLARPDLRPVFEPALRADFALYAGYFHEPAPPVPAPVTVLHGRWDTELRRGGLLGWRRHTSAGTELVELDAGHWLVDDAAEAVAAVLAARLPAAAR